MFCAELLRKSVNVLFLIKHSIYLFIYLFIGFLVYSMGYNLIYILMLKFSQFCPVEFLQADLYVLVICHNHPVFPCFVGQPDILTHLVFCHLGPGISHFSKELWFLLVTNGI